MQLLSAGKHNGTILDKTRIVHPGTDSRHGSVSRGIGRTGKVTRRGQGVRITLSEMTSTVKGERERGGEGGRGEKERERGREKERERGRKGGREMEKEKENV